MNSDEEARLRGSLELVAERAPGKTAEVIRSAIRERWTLLCAAAEDYGQPVSAESWKSAKTQWQEVAKARKAALECVANFHAAMAELGEKAKEAVFGCHHHELPASALDPLVRFGPIVEMGVKRCQEKTRQYSGRRAEDGFDEKCDLMEVLELIFRPGADWEDLKWIAVAIDAWQSGKGLPEDNRSFERAALRVSATFRKLEGATFTLISQSGYRAAE